jgi:hypothetical protein
MYSISKSNPNAKIFRPPGLPLPRPSPAALEALPPSGWRRVMLRRWTARIDKMLRRWTARIEKCWLPPTSATGWGFYRSLHPCAERRGAPLRRSCSHPIFCGAAQSFINRPRCLSAAAPERNEPNVVKRMSAMGQRGWTRTGYSLCFRLTPTNGAPPSACNSRNPPRASTIGRHGESSPCAGCGCRNMRSGSARTRCTGCAR